jgi:hypothetical protein
MSLPDGRPPKRVNENFVKSGLAFRFSNHLHALVNIVGSRIAGYEFCEDSNIYANTSLGIPPQQYEVIRNATRFHTKEGTEGVVFEQIAGARAKAPEVFGAFFGELVGRYALPIAGPYRVQIGGLVGFSLASIFTNLPPVWTHVELRLIAMVSTPVNFVAIAHF